MRALVGDLSADVAQCGYFGIKNTVMFYGGRCPAGGGVEKVEKNKKQINKTVLSVVY